MARPDRTTPTRTPPLRTVIGHEGMEWCNPIGWEDMGELHDAMRLRRGARILDLACGKGALLVRLVDWTPDARGVGVDQLPPFLEQARRAAEAEGVAERVTFELADVRRWSPGPRAFDVVCCVGARPWGSRRETLQAMAALTRPGGCVVLGEGYWRQEPDPAYLEALGCDADEHEDLAGTLDAGHPALDLEWWTACSPEQLDAYERRYLGNLLAWGRAHDKDPDAPALVQGARRWRDAHLRWGRDTFGFVIALWRVAPAPTP